MVTITTDIPPSSSAWNVETIKAKETGEKNTFERKLRAFRMRIDRIIKAWIKNGEDLPSISTEVLQAYIDKLRGSADTHFEHHRFIKECFLALGGIWKKEWIKPDAAHHLPPKSNNP